MKYKQLYVIFILVLSVAFAAPAQTIRIDPISTPSNAKLNRARGQNMLKQIKEVLEQHYYDKTFRGIDLDARFKVASERIKTLDTNWQIFRTIAQVLVEFDDSHTLFYPPNRSNRVEYGFTLQMIGQNCIVTDVKRGSDAEAKGLKIGDTVTGVGKYIPTRENLWKLNYILYWLDPQEQLTLQIAGPNNSSKEMQITASFKSFEDRIKEAEKRRKEKRENPYRCYSIDGETIACRLDTFAVEKKFIDQMMTEVAKHKKLVLDLRGNGGGYVKMEEYLTGHFFDRNLKIADFVMRDKKKERVAKVQSERNFKGDLVVLIDSNSASASEVFSRVIQLEKRGRIVGDVSSGAVMTSYQVQLQENRGVPGYETISVFGMNVTVADLIMSDGNRLEKVGVIPDHPIGPTGNSLLNGNDPVLAFAANLLGSKISPSDAGKFNFIRKKSEDEEKEDDQGTDVDKN